MILPLQHQQLAGSGYHQIQSYEKRTPEIHPTQSNSLMHIATPEHLPLKPSSSSLHDSLRNQDQKFRDKGVYSGNLQNNVPHGYGTFKFDSGAVYEGDFNNGLCHGNGKYLGVDGSVYQGHFINNKAEGLGKYWSPEGYSYEGEWKLDLPDGKGKATYANKETYDG